MGAWVAVLAAGAAPVSADEKDAPPVVTLDQLLTIPSSLDLQTEQHDGATRSEWRAKYVAAQQEVATAESELDDALERLKKVSAEKGGMSMSAPMPGGGGKGIDDSPLDYGLKQEIRHNRDEVSRTERELQELTFEASLSGVPPEWLTEEDE